MAITLGRNCSISVGGNIASARNVTISKTAKTIDVEEFGSRVNAAYSVGYELTASIEMNDVADVDDSYITNGTSLTVSGGAGGWSFPAIVTGISETFGVDGVATFTVECRITRVGLR